MKIYILGESLQAIDTTIKKKEPVMSDFLARMEQRRQEAAAAERVRQRPMWPERDETEEELRARLGPLGMPAGQRQTLEAFHAQQEVARRERRVWYDQRRGGYGPTDDPEEKHMEGAWGAASFEAHMEELDREAHVMYLQQRALGMETFQAEMAGAHGRRYEAPPAQSTVSGPSSDMLACANSVTAYVNWCRAEFDKVGRTKKMVIGAKYEKVHAKTRECLDSVERLARMLAGLRHGPKPTAADFKCAIDLFKVVPNVEGSGYFYMLMYNGRWAQCHMDRAAALIRTTPPPCFLPLLRQHFPGYFVQL